MKSFLWFSKHRVMCALVFIVLGGLFVPKDLIPVDFRVIDSQLKVSLNSPAMALAIDQLLPIVEEPVPINEKLNLKSGQELKPSTIMELNREFLRFSEEELLERGDKRSPTGEGKTFLGGALQNPHKRVLDNGVLVIKGRDEKQTRTFSEKLQQALKKQYAIYPMPTRLSTLLASSPIVHRPQQHVKGPRSVKRLAVRNNVVVDLEKEKPISQTKRTGNRALLTGQVVLKGGLVYTGQEHLEIFHEVQGEKQAVAQTSMETGEFRIPVDFMKEGDLVAELRNSSGELLGESRTPLLSIGKIEEPLTVSMTPLLSRIAGRIVSAYSYNKYYIPVQADKASVYPLDIDLDIDERGYFKREDILLRGSQYILSVEARDHWKSLVMTDSLSEILVHMFPHRMIESLYGLVNETPEPEFEGVIWGKVLVKGHAMKGAKVDLAINDAIGPIYFNDLYLPDKLLKQTTANGLFAYLKVPPGVHALRMSYSGEDFLTEVVAVEPHSVTRSDVKVDSLKSEFIYVYDALTGEPAQTDVLYSGSDRVYLADGGSLKLKFNRGHRLLFLESLGSDEHYPTRIIVDRKDGSIRMPLASRNWINSIKAKMKVNYIPSVGHILGFMNHREYDVLLNHPSPYSQLVYFDKAGQPILGGDTKKQKYGFLLFNVNPGLGGLMIDTNSDAGVLSKIFYADSGHLSVVTTGISSVDAH